MSVAMSRVMPFARLRLSLLRAFRQRAVVRLVAWLLLVAMLPVHLSCHTYYRTRAKQVSAPSLTMLATSKIFILHQGNLTWQLVSPHLTGEMLAGTKSELYSPLTKYDIAPVNGRSNRYQAIDRKVVMNIVHVYISEYQQGTEQEVTIPLSAIERIDLVESDTGKTTGSYLLAGVGIAIGVMVLTYIIILLTKSSCPFVYAHDGQQYRFQGEAYGGAIFAPLERDDYMPVPSLRPEGGQYRLKLTNELKERQFTDVAELWVVDHAPGVKVLLDQRGGVHTISRPQAPLRVVSAAGAECTAQLQAADRNSHLFNEKVPANTANSLTLTFAKPAQAQSARLELRAQNSLWLDYLYGEFAKKFGSYYTKWAEQEKQLPAATLNQWLLDQGLPLKVYLETNRGWQLVEHIPMVGPLAARDLVVPLDLSNVPGPEVRVKIEAGFMFWEVDYAALDASPEQPTAVEKCRPTTALDEAGRDQRDNLAAADGQHLRQLHPGTEVTLAYRPKPTTSTALTQRSSFLRTRGYYEHIREYQGLPNLPELYGFRKPGRFIEFSKEKYYETTQQLTLSALRP